MTDAEKQNLIELVQQHTSLWNEEDVQYKSFHSRAKAWREVAKDMEVTFKRTFDVDVLQRTFKNLRDVYVRKRRAYQDAVRRNSGLQAGALERFRAWPFYNSFVFLDPVNDEGERYCNVETIHNDNNSLLDVEEISDITAAEAFDMQSETGSCKRSRRDSIPVLGKHTRK
ncbi:unnamed protein product [Cylicocyclus nassatus]|uniref:MADF domain-containing protein n=1 Tax=Cylicocyclus nassatus TaxID=53992 RepID=A0AA36DPE6_CYLNA|nr:unnamed protein product [Cylicocyclus nassatus]